MNYMFLPLKRYARFSGRSRRKEYWMFALFQVIVYAAIVALVVATSGAGLFSGDPAGIVAAIAGAGVLLGIYGLFALAMLIPQLAVTGRRLHDTGRSGWWIGALALSYVGLIAATLATGATAVADPAGPTGTAAVTGGIVTLVASLLILGLALTIFVFTLLNGNKGPNRYGPDPKGDDYDEVFR